MAISIFQSPPGSYCCITDASQWLCDDPLPDWWRLSTPIDFMTADDVLFFERFEQGKGNRLAMIAYAAMQLAQWAHEQPNMMHYVDKLEQGNTGQYTDTANERWRQVCYEMVQVFCHAIVSLTNNVEAYNMRQP